MCKIAVCVHQGGKIKIQILDFFFHVSTKLTFVYWYYVFYTDYTNPRCIVKDPFLMNFESSKTAYGKKISKRLVQILYFLGSIWNTVGS